MSEQRIDVVRHGRNRGIAHQDGTEFDALRDRLQSAREALRSGGAGLQSVARGYYVVFALASFLAGKYEIRASHVRNGVPVTDQNFSHAELPSLVYTLYSGNKRETIRHPGSTPGIGAGRYDADGAYRNADKLMRARLEADYGPSRSAEPYGMARIDAWLTLADDLIRDLETLL